MTKAYHSNCSFLFIHPKKSIKGDVVKREDSIAQDNDVVYDEGGGSEYVLVISAMRGYNKLNATNHKRRDQLL